MKVIPAIMPESFADLREKVERVASLVDSVQVDIMDGYFVPGRRTWPHLKSKDDSFEAMGREEIGLPQWEKIFYEIDLMTREPETHIEEWVRAGAGRIIFHVESVPDPLSFVRWFGEHYGNFTEGPAAVELLAALENDTPLESLDHLIPELAGVQLMGIARVGFQGQPFDERVLARISELRQNYSELIISVDGGVNKESAALLRERGADRVVSGSFIFENPNPASAIEYLASL